MPIKVGAKVRLQNIPSYLRGIKNGDEGIVSVISNDPIQPYHIYLENGSVRTFSKEELKLLNKRG